MSKSVALYKKVCYYIIAKGRKETQIMYICLKTNENFENTVKQLRFSNLKIDVTKYDHASFIRMNLSHSGFSAYIDFYILKGLLIYSQQDKVEIFISLKDILTIYDLD